jgi:hypothetical protein
VLFGATVWLLFLRSTNATVLVVLVLGSAAFGAFTVLGTRRRQRRRLRDEGT